MKILLFGKGQLGTVIYKQLINSGHQVELFKGRIEDSVLFNDKLSEIEEENFYTMLKYSDCVINTIAVTDTRKCKQDWNYTYKVNAEFPIRLAKLLNNIDHANTIKLFSISSGCIFDGNQFPHHENSPVSPKIEYAYQKYQAEAIRHIYDNLVIIRPRMLFSDLMTPSNLLYKVAKFTELLPEFNSITNCYDVANFIEICLEKDVCGIFNFTNDSLISPLEIKKMINDYLGITSGVKVIQKEALHNKIGMMLTDTWLKSNHLFEYYRPPNVFERMREMIKKADWLKTINVESVTEKIEQDDE